MRSERVLVSMKPYLGDAVMAQPAIESLTRTQMDPCLLTSELAAQLFPKSIGSSGCLKLEPARSLSSSVKVARRLRSHRFQVAILVNLSFRSALICRLARIPRRIGHVRDGRSFLLTDRLDYRPREFQASSVARLLAPLGIEVTDPQPRLQVEDEIRARCAELLKGATIGFHPGSRDAWKQIPVEKTICVLGELRARGHTLAMFGGPEEAEVGRAIRACFEEGIVDLIGRTSILEAIGCFSQLRASFGGDTGVMHLSAASGCPTVQVFGSDRADRWGHSYAPHRLIRAPGNDMNRVSEGEILHSVLEAAR